MIAKFFIDERRYEVSLQSEGQYRTASWDVSLVSLMRGFYDRIDSVSAIDSSNQNGWRDHPLDSKQLFLMDIELVDGNIYNLKSSPTAGQNAILEGSSSKLRHIIHSTSTILFMILKNILYSLNGLMSGYEFLFPLELILKL